MDGEEEDLEDNDVDLKKEKRYSLKN